MAAQGLFKRFCVAFFCNIIYLIATEAVTTPAPLTIFNNKTKGDSKDDFELRLTKLLDIHLGGEPEQLKSYLRSIVYQEVQKTYKGIETDTRNSESGNVGKETLLMLLDSLAQEIQSVRNSLKELNADIDWIKVNAISNSSSSVYCSDNTTKRNFMTKSSIGPSYNPNKLTAVTAENNLKNNIPKNCKEVQERGYNVSGVYEIRPRKSEKSFMVLCDMETRGGGWTHFQKRYDGSQEFFLDYRDYKFGFGDLEGEFWLGLENIYLLTAFEVNELLVEIVDRDNIKASAHYKAFGIGSEPEGYPLNVLRGFSGDAGDSLVQHVGSKFSTKDFDQDDHDTANCAQVYWGAWWYKKCHASNLNGKFINVVIPKQYAKAGMHWMTFRNHDYCHAKSRMLVRPADK